MARLKPAAEKTFAFVDAASSLRELLSWLTPAARVAIDTEADSLYHYYEKVCLIQLTARGRNFVIDPLAGLDLKPFLSLLADKTLMLHGADYDLRMLRGSFGFRPKAGVIDTMIAAQLIGREEFGLASLVERHFGYRLSKSGQKSDWSRRPLTPTQLGYAVDDTRFVEPLADFLLDELERLGRAEWFRQSCDAVIEVTEEDRVADPKHEWRIRGVRDLTPRQAAFVREIWRWREREAQRVDRPPFKIMTNRDILKLARWAERNPDEGIERAPRLPGHFRAERKRSLAEAIRAARELDRSEWPAPRRRGLPGPKGTMKGITRLREGVAELAGELGLEASVIAPRAALENVARNRPTDAEGIRKAGDLLAWQAELLEPIVRPLYRTA